MSEAADPGPDALTMWRHLKTDHVYVVISLGVIEATMTEAVIYRRRDFQADARVWVRPLTEFLDGRFAFVGYAEDAYS